MRFGWAQGPSQSGHDVRFDRAHSPGQSNHDEGGWGSGQIGQDVRFDQAQGRGQRNAMSVLTSAWAPRQKPDMRLAATLCWLLAVLANVFCIAFTHEENDGMQV